MSDAGADATPINAEAPEPAPPMVADPAQPLDQPLDLDAIERDLADVETALARLDDGAYWSDEVTGDELPDELLADRPTARRLAPR